ncbi:GtrA family protein [Polynucleobacter wuianus]|uniref:GtrA family protein n=1 Tax=Polynucleobacter wuianus TaxID=1743168 RepID=UPI000AFADE31|nr:GtrA family protein [Polynucleobacter wuianus]
MIKKLSSKDILLRYILIAILATAINIAIQIIFLRVYHGENALILSVLCATAIGLFLRYELDKKYIFNAQHKNMRSDVRKFLLYSSMGIFSTAIFWLTEWAFHIIFASNLMRYVGAGIGLSTGYYVKYHLDKKFVFNNSISV